MRTAVVVLKVLTSLHLIFQGHDLNLDIKRVVANRHWCNKLWNAIRFALLNLGPDFLPSKGFPSECSSLPKACQWVLSKLAFAISSTIESFATYKFGAVIQVRPQVTRVFSCISEDVLHAVILLNLCIGC